MIRGDFFMGADKQDSFDALECKLRTGWKGDCTAGAEWVPRSLAAPSLTYEGARLARRDRR
jgi:hypothetical protein